MGVSKVLGNYAPLINNSKGRGLAIGQVAVLTGRHENYPFGTPTGGRGTVHDLSFFENEKGALPFAKAITDAVDEAAQLRACNAAEQVC